MQSRQERSLEILPEDFAALSCEMLQGKIAGEGARHDPATWTDAILPGKLSLGIAFRQKVAEVWNIQK
jgi:hypothetical protein